MFNLLEKENVGTITLNDKVRISDPCYGIDTWCAGTLDNVLEGKYNCFSQSVDTGSWGVRIASIEVRHEDYNDVEPVEVQDIDVGVDSGQAGIYDLDYFIKVREDKDGEDEWYDRVSCCTYKRIDNPDYIPFEESEWWKDDYKLMQKVENIVPDVAARCYTALKNLEGNGLDDLAKEYIKKKNLLETKDWYENYYIDKAKYNNSKQSVKQIGRLTADTLDGKCLVSSSGDGDGSYTCIVGRNKDGKIVAIKIDYYRYKEDEEYED